MKIALFSGFIFLQLLSSVCLADVYGLFMVVKGDVKVTAVADGQVSLARVGKKVFPGDVIEAGGESRAKVVMSDKNVLNISPDTKIKIEIYRNDNQGSKKVELNVIYGKLRATVEQKYDGEQNTFQVKTPNVVAGVRGTDFLTSYNPQTQESNVVTFRGLVAVGLPGPSGQIKSPVFVKPGQSTSSAAGKAPEAPRSVPTNTLKNMNRDSMAEAPRAPSSVISTAGSISSLVQAKDLTPDAKDIQVAGPPPVVSPGFTAPQISPPKNPYVQGVIDDHNAGNPVKIGVTITH